MFLFTLINTSFFLYTKKKKELEYKKVPAPMLTKYYINIYVKT